MATKTFSHYFCDACEKQKVWNEMKFKQQIQVIFTTDQTEGRSCDRYLSFEQIDLCLECYDKVLLGNYIWAKGAQGNNKYYFNDRE